MGERDDCVSVGFQHPVDLSKDAVEVIDETQRPDRDGDIDLVSADEGQLGRPSLMKLDGDLMVGGQRSGRGELVTVVVGGDDAGAATSETNGGVAGAAAEIEDSLAFDLAQEASVDVGAEAGTELDMVDGSVCRGAGVIARHGLHVTPQ